MAFNNPSPGRLCLAAALALCLGCGAERTPEAAPPVSTLFTRLPASFTGVAFENRLRETEAFNVFTYRNFYNGGGVGLADFNGDGLTDLYLTANQQPNRLYLNRGGLRFEDVTDRAGVAGRRAWSTGVSIADVNGDGRPDLYVCNAGNVPGDDRRNELFINQGPGADGVPRFTEAAAAYGLDDPGYAIHAAFFDYDRDGDLDVYLVNNSFRPVSHFGVGHPRLIRDALGGDRLYRHDRAPDGTRRFTDVSEAAGLYGSEIAFGLSATVSDVDRDGWPDLYVANDFFERDYLYMNNGDGTFTEELERRLPSISLSSMGADIADVNHDGYPEIYVTDMLPPDERRLKQTTTFEPWDVYRANVAQGYHHQFTRNMLHLNRGDGTFSEVGRLAGVEATDWSWAPLLADFDNDGQTDLFVTNGVLRDVTDQDFLAFLGLEVDLRVAQDSRGDYTRMELIDRIPSVPIPNHLFAGAGGLRFTERAAAWGLDAPGFSSGAAYGDLDDDGDLDLVVSNLNAPVAIYRNETDTLRRHHYLKVRLVGEGDNRFGYGARLHLQGGSTHFYLEQMPTRGYQSSVDPVLHAGLGPVDTLAGVQVTWPDGRVQRLADVPADTTLVLYQRDAVPDGRETPPAPAPRPRFTDVTDGAGLAYVHHENAFDDFSREPLLYRMFSTEGPRAAVGDVNGDGRDDLYLGGAKETPGRLLLQQPGGGYREAPPGVFAADAISEDVDAAFFDADGDGDRDLYVVSGGSEFSSLAPALRDRLYLNDGRGGFTRAEDALPSRYDSGACVDVADVDGDGDPDLFVGGRLVPWQYGRPAPSVLLRNDGHGRFTDVTAEVAPDLARAGLVTDAAWADVDGDGDPDLMLAGEWMPLTLFRNDGGRLVRTDAPGLAEHPGWWTRLLADDLDGDGDLDFVAGNHGLNTRLRASADAPLTLYVSDFDHNGYTEQLLTYDRHGTSYPVPTLEELVRQLPFLTGRLAHHADYAGATVQELFTPQELAEATVLHATELRSSVVENLGDGTFRLVPLPTEAQLAPVYGLLADDFDGDGRRDLLLGGNLYAVKPQLGRMDAGYGLLLRGDGAGGFTPVPAAESGFRIDGEVRDLAFLRDARRGRLVLALRNDAPARLFRTP